MKRIIIINLASDAQSQCISAGGRTVFLPVWKHGCRVIGNDFIQSLMVFIIGQACLFSTRNLRLFILENSVKRVIITKIGSSSPPPSTGVITSV